ncbi:MAG: hypothetical protein ACI4I8_00545 [Oscillospiraceae bacterium]
MKKKTSGPAQRPQGQSVKKTIVINCFTGEEREVDRRKIKIIDGMEIGNTRVELDNGVKLAVVGDGKYHTLGKPKERWAEVAEVRVLPDGEYGDGELLGWTPLFFAGRQGGAPGTRKSVPNQHDQTSSPKPQPSKENAADVPAGGTRAGQGAQLPSRPRKGANSSSASARPAKTGGKLPPRPKQPKGRTSDKKRQNNI